MRALVFTFTCFLALALLACDTQVAAPDVRLQTIDGAAFDLVALRGQTVVVNFWSVSCVLCRREIPELSAFYDEQKNAGVKVIGIAMTYDPPHLVVDYRDRTELSYPIVWDTDGSLAAAFGDIKGTPITFVIDPHGQIQARYVGKTDFEHLRDLLASRS